MKKNQDLLDAQYAKATARLANADADVLRVSRKRLDELAKLPERQRFAHLEDPLLIPKDRSTLRRGLAARLITPKARIHLGRSATAWMWNGLRQNLVAVLLTLAVGTPLCVWTLKAWRNTGNMQVFNQPVTLNWTLPSGEVRQNTVPAGTRGIVVQHWRTNSVARYWIPKEGYATAPIIAE